MEDFDFDKFKQDLIAKHSESVISDKDVISAALYPKVFDDYAEFRSKYGPVEKLDTKTFLVGPDIAENFVVSTSLLSESLHQKKNKLAELVSYLLSLDTVRHE